MDEQKVKTFDVVFDCEAGLLTPPLGICVFTVKAAVDRDDISLGTIFMGAILYWVMLLMLIVLLYHFPTIATFLPGKM